MTEYYYGNFRMASGSSTPSNNQVQIEAAGHPFRGQINHEMMQDLISIEGEELAEKKLMDELTAKIAEAIKNRHLTTS